jgi:hypothetical protein
MMQGGRAEEREHVLAPQGGGYDDPTVNIHRMNLEDVFRQIEANRRYRVQVNLSLAHLRRSFEDIRQRQPATSL